MEKMIHSLKVLDISEVPVLAIRAKQSVRATFRLSRRSVLALSALSSQLGIKQKSLFDLLMDDREVLAEIADKSIHFKKGERRTAKTFVISRQTLDNLHEIADRYNTPRDALVEHSIERVLPLLEREKQKYQQRKRIMENVLNFQQMSEQLMAQAEKQLEEDDPLLEKISLMMKSIRKNCRNAEQFMERCCRMEEIEFFQKK